MVKIVLRNHKHEEQFPPENRHWKLVAYCGQLVVAEIIPFRSPKNTPLKYRLFCDRYNPTGPDTTFFPAFSTVGEALTAMWDMLKNPVAEQQAEPLKDEKR